MTIDVSQILAVFYEESFEGLQVMEAGLLEMESGNVKGETLNSVFRAAHSIRGGGATFGLHDIAEFTRVMETLLDEMRAGTREMTTESHEILLSSAHCLRDMLVAKQGDAALDEQKAATQKQRLQTLLGTRHNEAHTSHEDAIPPTSSVQPVWRIVFRPAPEMFMPGNDPLRFLRVLERLGKMRAIVDFSKLPQLGEPDVHGYYPLWVIELTGEITRDGINELFDRAIGEYEVEVEQFVTPSQHESGTAAPCTTPPWEQGEPAAAESMTPAKGKDAGSIRVSIEKIDSLINKVGELVTTQSTVSQLGDELATGRFEQLHDVLVQQTRLARELQEGVLGIRTSSIRIAKEHAQRNIRGSCREARSVSLAHDPVHRDP